MFPSFTPSQTRTARRCSKNGRCVAGRPQVRLAHDLNERRAGAVVVDIGLPVGVDEALVQRLAGVLFHVHACDPHAARPVRPEYFDQPFAREGLLVLRDLISLRQVRIEIVLAREDRRVVDAAAQRERRANGQVHRGPVEDRQHARESEADRADVRVGRRPERGAAAAEDLGGRLELRVDLEADDRFVGHARSPAATTASDRFWCSCVVLDAVLVERAAGVNGRGHEQVLRGVGAKT
jgi:hypothetical protein